MPVHSLSFCNLVAIWFETFLYGAYVVLLIPTVHVLLLRPFSSRYGASTGTPTQLNPAYLAGTFALFTFSTIHVAAGLAMLLEAFILFPDISSESYFSHTTSPLNLLRTTVFLANIAFADAFMVHRLYIMWFRSTVVSLIPLVNLTFVLASGIVMTVLSSEIRVLLPSHSSTSTGFSGSLTPTLRILVPLHIGMLFTTNLWITILAGINLWKEITSAHEDGLTWRRVIGMVAETGAVFPFTALIAVLFSIAGTNGQIIPYTALSPLAALLPTLMILAVELGYTDSTCDSRLPRYPYPRSMILPMTPLGKGFQVAPTTFVITPTPQSAPPDSSDAGWQTGFLDPTGRDPPTPLPLLSTRRNIRLPPVPATPPPPRPTKRRHEEVSVMPLTLSRHGRPDSTPPAPHTPRPRQQLPSPFETHFPRSARHARVSQQTFNPRRESAGRGGTAFTTFGDSSLARMLTAARGGDQELPLAATLEASEGTGKKRQEPNEKRLKSKKPAVPRLRLPPGVHMTKAVEERIDYIDEEKQ